MLGELITSKTRLRLLIKFFVSQANTGYLNGLATEMGESTNAIRKELNHLQGVGYLKKVKINNKVEYKANTDHPLFEVLRKVVFKHLGLADVVDTVLERMGDVDKIILVGDYARGNDSGIIEVFLIGKDINRPRCLIFKVSLTLLGFSQFFIKTRASDLVFGVLKRLVVLMRLQIF